DQGAGRRSGSPSARGPAWAGGQASQTGLRCPDRRRAFRHGLRSGLAALPSGLGRRGIPSIVVTSEAQEPPEATAIASDGREVVVPAGIWRGKISRDHPELADHLADVISAVANPDHVEPDALPGRTRFYRRGVGPSRWLLVVEHGWVKLAGLTVELRPASLRPGPLGGSDPRPDIGVMVQGGQHDFVARAPLCAERVSEVERERG